MLVATCQVDDSTKTVSYLADGREFGNVSEDQFSSSAIDFINASNKALHENGIIRGFDVESSSNGLISFSGGEAFVNGKLVLVNAQVVTIPTVLEALAVTPGGPPTTTSTVNVITWFICVNDEGEIELVASTDFDPFGAFVTQYQAAALDNTRLFYALNPNAAIPAPYQIRGTYFAGLVINQPDVVPIAIAVATVTGSGSPVTYSISSMVLNDARRYITNGYGGLAEPLTLGTFASFRNIDSLINWLYQFNNLYSASVGTANPISNRVIVKGHVSITATVPLGYVFGEVFFEGDNGCFDVFIPTGFDIHSNVHFDKLVFNYLFDPVVYSDATYNPSDLINTGKGLIHMGITAFDRNVSVTNCHFVWVPLIAGIGGDPPAVQPPPITSVAINRYSFINIELSNPTTPAPTILQSVDISNNTFQENTLPTFAPANQDTARSAIAIVSLSNTINAPGGGLKLINATIRNNVCDKDQMIAIVPANTSTAPSPNVVTTAINTTACIIEANTCGTISIFTQYDTPTDVNFTANFINFTLDKNNGLIIKDNTCKYITSTDARGVEFPSNVITILPNSGPITISDNTASWIKLPVNINPSAPVSTSVIIKNNVLNAYDTNFRKNYLNGNNAALTNTAIEVFMVGTSLNNSITVDGNWISPGIYATISPVTTTFNYDNGIYSQHDANICNNTISGLTATLFLLLNPIGIQINPAFSTSASSNIHHNKLYRLSSVWTAYIDADATGSGHTLAGSIITNNFFDQITPDNVHLENQIINANSLSNIHDNTNQTVSTGFSLADAAYNYSGNSGGPSAVVPGAFTNIGPANSYRPLDVDIANSVIFFRYSQSGGVVPTSTYTGIIDVGTSPAAERNFTFTIPLTDHLPPGVKVLSAAIGVWVQNFGAATFAIGPPGTQNAFTLSLTSYNDNLTSGSAAGITDVKSNIAPNFPPSSADSTTGFDGSFRTGTSFLETLLINIPTTSGTGYRVVDPIIAAGATQFVIVNTPNPPVDFTTGYNYRLNATFDVNFLRSGGTTTGDSIIMYFSPVLVTYRW